MKFAADKVMKFEELSHYESVQMRMSHVYPPVMFRELLKSNGEATVEQIAKALLSHDRSQVEYYATRTKNMVGNVFTNNGVVVPNKTGKVNVNSP